MTLFKAAPTVFCMALLGATFSPTAKADDYNKKTTITFSGPVEIPGVHMKGWGILPAGTYVFKLLNSPQDRHIVQILSKDELTVYATILAIPDYRLKPTDKTVMTFNEGVKGQPEALRAWFYPGAQWGDQFVYPKARAVELAQVTKVPVLAVTTEVFAEAEKPAESAIVVQLQQAPIVAIQPTGEQVEIAQVVQAPPAQAAPALVAVNKLPDTASSMPLIALFGLLALGGALTIRSVRKREL